VPGELLLLIDGPGLVYRSYFAFVRNPLVSSSGEQTSVAFGFVRALSRLAETRNPDYWGVAFDTPEPTFRHKHYEKYKANRPSMPDEMIPQLDRVDELLSALRVKRFSVEGFEADDLMGTLARRAADRGMNVVLVTEDKDFCQLVSDRVRILSLPKGERAERMLDRDGVRKKLGVSPEQVVDYLALVGDSSDNVPGVRGIGPKTAEKLLNTFPDIEELYANLVSVEPERIRRLLLEHKDDAFMSRELVTLDLNAPIDFDFEELKRSAPDVEKLLALLGELEFGRTAEGALGAWMEVFAADGPAAGDSARVGAPAKSEESAAGGRGAARAEMPGRIADYLSDAGEDARFGFSLGPDAEGRMGLAVTCESLGEAFYLAEGASGRAGVEDFLSSQTYRKTAHDLKAEAHAAAGAGWRVSGVTGDVKLASYLLAPEDKHDLESLVRKHLGGEAPRGENVTAADVLKWKSTSAMKLDGVLSPRLEELGMTDLYRNVEIPLAGILMEMERAGVSLDVRSLGDLSSKLERMIARSEEEIYCLAGTTFNINSPQQLSDILFKRLGLPHKRRTKTGYSTNSSVLEELAGGHELPREILNYRQLAKLKSTYVDALPRMVDPGTGRVHASFHQTGTATGRLSSSNPNLQNIPIRTELGAQIRKTFVPGGGDWAMLAADYSQIELRIMAHLSGDTALRESFVRGEDAHAATAAAVFGVPLGEVTEELRSRAKTVNYGVMYGMGALGLARTLGIPRGEAAQFIGDYFEKMPSVKAFLSELVERARVEGSAATILNRRRPLPAILSSDRRARAYAERMAINTPLQGSAADIIKKAMVDLHALMAGRSMKAKLILQVHDELVFECPREETDELRDLVVATMESSVALSVPLTVSVGTGENWWETHR
jgi:DNA polymerase-1